MYKQKQTHVYSNIHVMLKVYSRNNQCYFFYCKENTIIVVKTDFHKQSIAKPEAIPMKKNEKVYFLCILYFNIKKLQEIGFNIFST